MCIFTKALGKLGNTVAETLIPQMFPCLPTLENIVAETKFAAQKAKIEIDKT
jgi:hypothetical protein